MNKVELTEAIATETEQSKKVVSDILEAIENVIIRELKKGGEVTLTGFGTFLVSHRAARTGVNPQNPGQKIQIAAVDVPKFRAGKRFKDAVK